MDLEEREGVDPVIERRCAECGTVLTKEEKTFARTLRKGDETFWRRV